MIPSDDRIILRNLAQKVREIASKDIQNERRRLWREHNSLKPTHPLIYVKAFAWHEVFDRSQLRCLNPLFRYVEEYLRHIIYRDTIGDDGIIEPWLEMNAIHAYPGAGETAWGVKIGITDEYNRVKVKARRFDPPLKEEEDLEKLLIPRHIIDFKATSDRIGKVNDIIGDILPVIVDTGPFYRVKTGFGGTWLGDISNQMGFLRGIEQLMWDINDRPDWLHKLSSFLSNSILKVHEEAENAGNWKTCNHENQTMPYALDLIDPDMSDIPVNRNSLWCFMASQEFDQVSPDMFDEFLLQYQIPIMEKFGLSAYGCCENLTGKIGKLKKIRNLRRIAVTPWADINKCAEQIGKDYVVSWRPSPTDMLLSGLDDDQIRQKIQETLKVFSENGCMVDIILKDVETVQGDPHRIKRWVCTAREAII